MKLNFSFPLLEFKCFCTLYEHSDTVSVFLDILYSISFVLHCIFRQSPYIRESFFETDSFTFSTVKYLFK